MSHHDEREELRLVREEVRLLREILRAIRGIPDTQQLSSIKIAFTKGATMAAVIGPVTLPVGAPATASVLGFDQNGAAFLGTIPPVTYAVDNAAIASSTPNADGLTDAIAAVSAGVANLTATVQGPNGPLTDTETITVTAVVPILSSIKLAFDTGLSSAKR